VRGLILPALSKGRIRSGQIASDDGWGLDGAFQIMGPCGASLRIISSSASPENFDVHHGWEHVSVSLPNRCPNWPEMSFVKDLFWTEDETVVQFHPPKSDYISNHPYCLHMFRNSRGGHELPPSILVGIKRYGDVSGDKGAQTAMRKELDAILDKPA
jgi:hypothetical protein